MPAYRIYWLDRSNHVTEADGLIAEAEDKSHLGMASAVEVWHGECRVVRVSANKPAA